MIQSVLNAHENIGRLTLKLLTVSLPPLIFCEHLQLPTHPIRPK